MNRAKIKKIQDFDKIAAGEVVDRPANVVKELIENSIDAHAEEIRIIIKQAGKNLIQIIDDGIGIPQDEVEVAFERHTSSKIRKFDDLETLSTLGFRGEALASIAAVSKVEITTKTTESDIGIKLIIEGGKVINKKEISSQVGTSIMVKNIFYNLPARKKFLKKDATELGHITDVIQRYALAYPHIHFIYMHNESTVLNCPGSNDLKTTVFHIYGKHVAKHMEPINVEEDTFKLYGLLGHSKIARNNRTYSSLFLNKRYVISDKIFRAVQEAYKGILMIGKYPFVILFIEVEPSILDFNVHPKKLHVRFADDEFISNKVYNLIRGFVEKLFIQQESKYLDMDLITFHSRGEKDLEEDQWVESEEKYREDHEKVLFQEDLIETDDQKVNLMPAESDPDEGLIQLQLSDLDTGRTTGKGKIPESVLREKYINVTNFPKLRLISSTGQLSNNIYVVLEGKNENEEYGIYLLDQHAASERITKEFFYRAYDTTKKRIQKLISPLKIEVSPSEKFFLISNLSEVKKLGFDFEHFGGNTFILREIPTVMQKLPDLKIINEIIGDITDIGKDKSFIENKEEIINYLACHKSIRGGDDLSLKDIRKLLIDLSKCKDPYHCAHGRPTLKFISFKELDKMFKRIV